MLYHSPLVIQCISHTFCLLYVESCIELSYDLYIVVIVNTHEFLNVMALTCRNDLIINWILLLLHVMPINRLYISHNSPPIYNHSLIEILLKLCVKPVVRSIPLL
jgi:hypothetical protein